MLLIFPVCGLDVIIHTWTGASDVCRHLRQTEKQEWKEQSRPPIHPRLPHLFLFFTPALSVVPLCLSMLDNYTLCLNGSCDFLPVFLTLGSFCLRVRMWLPSPPPDETPVCLLKDNLEISVVSFCQTCDYPVDAHTHAHWRYTQTILSCWHKMMKTKKGQKRERWASTECDWTLEELIDHRLLFMVLDSSWPFCLRSTAGSVLGSCYGWNKLPCFRSKYKWLKSATDLESISIYMFCWVCFHSISCTGEWLVLQSFGLVEHSSQTKLFSNHLKLLTVIKFYLN